MFANEDYEIEGVLKRTFYFTTPYPTTKVRLDELEGAGEIAFRVEFIGLDRTQRNAIINPMNGGYIKSSKQT